MTSIRKDSTLGNSELPSETMVWQLNGAGFDNLHEVRKTLPKIKDDELLVRHDACSICFSDIKIINLGPDHPRLANRDMVNNPVVMGHEVSLTVLEVGDKLVDRFHVGERYAIQPDVYHNGVNCSYGYALDGGMAEFGVVTREVIEGDGGCYLIPLDPGTGYAEAGLVEPWACVVAAYDYPNYRAGLLPGGRALFINAGYGQFKSEIASLTNRAHGPSVLQYRDVAQFVGFDECFDSLSGESNFDDIVVLGHAAPDFVSLLAALLGTHGILNASSVKTGGNPVPLDIGRVHYEQRLIVGETSPEAWDSAYSANTRKDLKPRGTALFVGAGGPMGQMHVQRAAMLATPPAIIVVSDTNVERLKRLRARFAEILSEKDIKFIAINPNDGRSVGEYGPFDDIICLIPSSEVVGETIPFLAEHGVYNLFAGVAKGTMADIDVSALTRKKQRLIGTSGSSINDLRKTLSLVETGQLSTNASVAAIGGLPAFKAGLEAVKSGEFPGKTVIYPTLSALPLISLKDLQNELPMVFEKLERGKYWTNDAEKELLRIYSEGNRLLDRS